MTKPATALQALHGAQAIAATPDSHVWLSASAGTGKTHVLTARVYRLLLSGVRPENILCLTFTKAGAAEMAERIHNRLAAWVQMDGPALAADLRALGEDYTPEAQDHARRLFAEVLEATGGGLRIQTIHAFCQQLLSAFPVEAGLIPGFRPLEAHEQAQLARNALAEMVLDAEATGKGALMGALQTLSLRLGEGAAEAYLVRCARRYDVMTSLPTDIRTWLFQSLDLPPGDVEAAIAAECTDDAFDMHGLARIAAAFENFVVNPDRLQCRLGHSHGLGGCGQGSRLACCGCGGSCRRPRYATQHLLHQAGRAPQIFSKADCSRRRLRRDCHPLGPKMPRSARPSRTRPLCGPAGTGAQRRTRFC